MGAEPDVSWGWCGIDGWRPWVRRFVTLPWLLQIGVSLLVLSVIGDLAYHGIGGLSHRLGHSLHLLTLVGMVTIMTGILLEADH